MKASKSSVKSSPVGKYKSRRRAGEFLSGPISWAWIKSAARAKGSALFVALTIRHFCTLQRQRTVRLSLIDLGCGIMSRRTVTRALRSLESRALIDVDRQAGQRYAITVLEMFQPQ
jgi:hypothetical protein